MFLTPRNFGPPTAALPRRWAALVLWSVAALLAPEGKAQPGLERGGLARQPVLHEPLPATASASRSDQLEMSRPNAAGQGGSALPQAILTSLGRIAKPPPAKDGDGTPTYAKREPPRIGVDRRTGADLELHYQVVFDPAVAPFKRDFVYDQLAPDLTVRMSGTGQQPLAGSAEPRPDHELFWGHVKLSLQAGKPVVLPSVAPTSQILSWQALPSTPLQFFRDDAGNFSVTAPADAQVDLRFLMDAPSAYFAAPLGTGGQESGGPARPQLDPGLQQRAAAMWPEIGVSKGMDRAATVAKLVEWFRSFRPGALDQSSGDPARDLVLSQRGVCRHRALGLMLMAHSLGIPTHYAMNEAHAFVEVWVPLASGGSAWQRVDLGGGSDSLELHAAQDKRLHQPLFRDPFPRPTAYSEQVGQVKVDGAPVDQAFGGAGQIKGAEGLEGGSAAPEPAGSGSGQDGLAAAAAPGNGSRQPPAADEAAARRQWLRQRAAGLAPRPTPPRPAAAQAPQPSDPQRLATSLHLEPLAAMAWIGEPIRLAGTLAAGAGAPRLPIEIWLIDPGQPTQARLLGTAPTDAEGHFTAELALPPDVPPQSYDIVARFAGDPRRAPCDSGP